MEFYPASVPVPEEKRTNRLLLRPLRATDVELDYDAVMSSTEQLRRWSQSGWPADDFTLAHNLTDLQRHEREHRERKAFTFTVLNPHGTRCLGCVYLIPLWPQTAQLCAGAAYAGTVRFWVRTSELANDLDQQLLATLREWFTTEWAFDCIVFTISQQDARQAALLSEAGLERRTAFTLSDGRAYWAFSYGDAAHPKRAAQPGRAANGAVRRKIAAILQHRFSPPPVLIYWGAAAEAPSVEKYGRVGEQSYLLGLVWLAMVSARGGGSPAHRRPADLRLQSSRRS